MKWRRDKKETTPALADIYVQLRQRVLTAKPDDIGLPPSEDQQRPWAVLMEMAYPEAVATLVSVADNTTSFYFSNGGGIIGAGEWPQVAEATQFFIASAQAFLPHMTSTSDFPLPEAGHVRFHVLTYGGAYTADVPDADIRQQHPLTQLYAIAHLVITRMREQEESTRQQRGKG